MDQREIKLAEEALAIQDACNLSGVVFAFKRAMQTLCELSHEEGKGTDWRNRHPVSVLFASKIASLTGADDMMKTCDAFDACHALIAQFAAGESAHA